MAAVLGDPQIGGFCVATVIDGGAGEIRLAVEDFLADRGRDDLVVVYVSGHGQLDIRGRLYLAGRDTKKDRLAATGVEASWVVDLLDEGRAGRQVLILDCCFSGAFARGAKGDPEGDLDLERRLHTHGRGRAVLTSSKGTEFSWEGNPSGSGQLGRPTPRRWRRVCAPERPTRTVTGR